MPSFRTAIDPSWIDYNGHLRDAYYSLIVSFAIDDFMDHLGLDGAYRKLTNCTIYTLELHLHYLHELKSTDVLEVATSVLDADRKRIHAGCRFTCPRIDGAAATADLMLMHVQRGETAAGAVFPDAVHARLQALKLPGDAGAAWAPASRKIAIKRR